MVSRDSSNPCIALSKAELALQGKSCQLICELSRSYEIDADGESIEEIINSIAPVLEDHFGGQQDAEEG